MSKLCLGLASALFLAAISFSGCCAPVGPMGPGCMDYGCNDCSGMGSNTQYIANGPLDALRNARQRMVCGSGCGEAYIGEWISTPPDAADPCCGDQFVGGATKCRPFCWQPGALFRGLYGQRFCSGDASSTPCHDGANFCDSGCGSSVVSAPASSVIVAPAASSCGCTASTQPVHGNGTQIVTHRPAVDAATSTQKAAVAKKVTNRKQPAKLLVR